MPFGRHYTISSFLLFEAGVIAFLFLFYWQMLLPMISGNTDVIPLRLMLLPIVYLFYTIADVIAIIVADVITTCYLVYYLADVIAMCVWQML